MIEYIIGFILGFGLNLIASFIVSRKTCERCKLRQMYKDGILEAFKNDKCDNEIYNERFNE